MRFLITGGKGMLGGDIARAAGAFGHHSVFAPGKDELDVRDAHAVLAACDSAREGWLVHCAAMVNVEGCARQPDDARAIIVDGTRHAIAAARQAGARFFYPQSFLTHDGAKVPIPEDEEQRPLSLYGELKLEAQRLVEDAFGEDALIVTMAGFFGGEERDKNFVGKIIPVMHQKILDGAPSMQIGDRIWQPTWTAELAQNSLHLMLAGSRGHYQMAAKGQASFAELAREIVAALGWQDRFAIEEVSAAAVSGNELGRRPDCAVLSATRLGEERLDLQRDWRSTLHAYLRHPFFDRYRF